MEIKKPTMLLSAVLCALAAAFAENITLTFYKGDKVLASFDTYRLSRYGFMRIEDIPSIYPIYESMENISAIRCWGVPFACATFKVSPKELLDGQTPVYTMDGIEPYEEDGPALSVDKSAGTVTVRFKVPEVPGSGTINVSIDAGDGTESASLLVKFAPEFQSATFYGPDFESMPYRPGLGLSNENCVRYCEKTIDINSTDEVRVAMNIAGGKTEDINEAVKCYGWELWSGNDADVLTVTKNEYEIVEGNGFDAIIGVQSGTQTGDVILYCHFPYFVEEDDYRDRAIIKWYPIYRKYHVRDFKKEYPIRGITVSEDNLELHLNEQKEVYVDVSPYTSWEFQRPTVEVADPTIVEVKPYEGKYLPVRGLKLGTTTITLKGYNDTQLVTKTITVTVDPVGSVTIDSSIGTPYIFVGGESQWKANACSISGALMDVPLTWSSDNPGVATVADGLVSGVSVGTANISASYGDIKSYNRRIRVVGAPAPVSDASGLLGFYEMDNDIVFLDADEAGQLVITGGYADGNFEGMYSLMDSYYLKEDAKAPATGSVRITKGAGEYEYTVKMNVKIKISETNIVNYKFEGTVEYLPE